MRRAYFKRKPKEYDDDDGRTIADMSQVSQPFPYSGPSAGQDSRQKEQPEAPGRADRPWEDTSLSFRERLTIIFGALRYALLIGLVYIAVFGVVIWLMVKFWT